MSKKIITKKQQTILTLILTFRFINSKQIQQFLEHKDHRRINAWLKDLAEKQYIIREYKPIYGTLTKPAVCYLSLLGRRYIRDTLFFMDDTYLVRLRGDKDRSKSFRIKCQLIADFYLVIFAGKETELIKSIEENLKEGVTLKPNTFQFFTPAFYSELAFVLLPHLKPDAYISKETKEGITHTCIFVLDAYIPRLMLQFWEGRFTGLKSYRSVLWKKVPRSRAPKLFGIYSELDRYIQTLIGHELMDEPTKIWWDARHHPTYKTLEVRSMDMPGTLDAVFDLAAMGLAIVAWQTWQYLHDQLPPPHPYEYWDENNIEVVRDGLDAVVTNFLTGKKLTVRQALDEELQAAEPVLDDLGIGGRIYAIRQKLGTYLTGADLQIQCYLESLTQQGLQLTEEHTTRSNIIAISDVIHLLVNLARQGL